MKTSSRIERCPTISMLMNKVCDLSKYISGAVAAEETVPGYHGIRDMRMMFIHHLIRNEKNVCFGGKIQVWQLGSKMYGFGKQPTPLDCRHDPDDLDTVFYDISLQFGGDPPNDWIDNTLAKANPEMQEHLLSKLKEAGHSLLLIINPETETYQIFDSNGENTTYNTLVHKYMVKEWLPKNDYVDYTENEDWWCPVGIQDVTDEGRCENWSVLWIYLLITCGRGIYELHQELLNKGKDYLRRLNDGWTCFMWAYCDISGIFEAYNRIMQLPSTRQKFVLLDRFHNGDLTLLGM